MVMENNEIKQLTEIFTSLTESLLKLKEASRDKYTKNKAEAQDDYQAGHAVGFHFGQLAAIEDTTNLATIVQSKVINVEKQMILALTKQVYMLESLLKELIVKLTNNQQISLEEISVIQEALKMINHV